MIVAEGKKNSARKVSVQGERGGNDRLIVAYLHGG